jgi:hypothetical protein
MPVPTRALLLLAPLVALALLAGASLPSCGGKVVVDGVDQSDTTDPADDAGWHSDPTDASFDVVEEPPTDAPEAPAQCLCPDAPGYAPCVKPLECCPVVGVCKNPASFNCTGSGKTCP